MAEVRMVLYEDDSVQVQYVDGSRLQLSPCGSEFIFEKAPPASAHPLEQPERIRQRTHFVISTYREKLQRALEFRNTYATCPFLSESVIPSERRKCVLIDVTEVRWPRLPAEDGVVSVQGGAVTVSSLDGHAYLCLSQSQHEFTVHFLCKVSQRPAAPGAGSGKSSAAQRDTLVERAGTDWTYGNVSRRKLRNPENEPHGQVPRRADPAGTRCMGAAAREEPLSGAKRSCLYAWVRQCCSVATCPGQWEYPLALALGVRRRSSVRSASDADVTQSSVLPSDALEEKGEAISALPRALLLSCPAPHLHRWNFGDSLLQEESDEEYSYPELVKVVWYKGITYRLTHKNENSIEIYPGDGSVFKSKGAYLGNFFTYYSHEGSEEKEEKVYSVSNLPPDRPGSQFSVTSLIRQATRILQHCARVRLSLSHNYRICCWKTAPGVSDGVLLPLLLRESLIPGVGRFLAYSDDKVHAVFLDGVTLTLNWSFGSFTGKSQVNQGLSLGWCKLTFPDGHDRLIQIEHPGPHESYVAAVLSWCRRLAEAARRAAPTHPSPLQENWSVASELEKIKKFNLFLENSGVLSQIPNEKNERAPHDYTPEPSETLLEENEKNVSMALKKTSEILQDIDYLLSNSKK